MNQITKLILAAAIAMPANAVAQDWAPAGDNIRTPWAEEVTPSNVLPEYPRPQMKRDGWKSLNGLWDYSVTKSGITAPGAAEGKILVPFAIESSLSGVGRMIKPEEALWYSTTFDVPKEWKGKRTLLNFGAVDWKAEVYVNDILLGTHTGGFTEFSFDITPYLAAKGSQKLTVKVTDATDKDGTYQPRGKQVSNPKGIWYTQVTGIWQTVWIEAVADGNISSYNAVANLKASTITVTPAISHSREGDVIVAELLNGKEGYDTENPSSEVISTVKTVAGNEIVLSVPNAQKWSPDSPYLYGLRLSLVRNGQTIDKVEGYAAMREVSVVRDQNNLKRMALNGEKIFHYGPLDQGWWPDGLYTAPTDEALKFDVEKTKELGFNMIRKHIKVEPARWYYHCDRLGILVWQDMPCIENNRKNKWDTSDIDRGFDVPVPDEWKANYYKEWKEIIDARKVFPCVAVWVPFNEAWGQFDTEKAVEFTKSVDPTRLVNPASGGNFRRCGDILDMHHYPNPAMNIYYGEYVNVVGEYGGIGLPVQGHLWQKDKNWGYVQYKTPDEVTEVYIKYAEQLMGLVKKGCGGAVYTQTTDVEGEVNGFMTYDRKFMKMDFARVAEMNRKVINSMK